MKESAASETIYWSYEKLKTFTVSQRYHDMIWYDMIWYHILLSATISLSLIIPSTITVLIVLINITTVIMIEPDTLRQGYSVWNSGWLHPHKALRLCKLCALSSISAHKEDTRTHSWCSLSRTGFDHMRKLTAKDVLSRSQSQPNPSTITKSIRF